MSRGVNDRAAPCAGLLQIQVAITSIDPESGYEATAAAGSGTRMAQIQRDRLAVHSKQYQVPVREPETILASLFGNEASKTFLDAYWPERHFYAHGPIARLPSILRCTELRSLDALAQRYTGPVAFGRGAVDARTISADTHPRNLFDLGFTVYLSDISGILPGGKTWLATLERELGIMTGCSKIGAFASPRGDGLPRHFDAEDVISVQLSGSKTFEVAKVDDLKFPVGRQFGPNMLPADELYPQASGGFPRPDGLKFERIRMDPGSVLFMPRGTWHTSHAEDDSFSISVGIRTPPGVDYLVHQLRSLLLQDPEWRRPFYGALHGARRDTELQRIDGLLATLPAALARLSAIDLAPPIATDPNLEIEQGRFQKVPMSALRLEHTDDRLRLTVTAWDHDWIERTTLQNDVPSQLDAALRWLSERQSAFAAAEFRQIFPSISQGDLWQLLDLLRKSGYLRRLWFPSLKRVHA
jgi:Cupin superfamily protein